MHIHLSIALLASSAKARHTIASARHASFAFIISLLVLLSPFIMSTSPQLIAAAGPIIPATNADERLDTNNYHSTINKSSGSSNTATASPPSTAIGTPTIQAPLQIPRTLQSTDLVNSLAFYEVTFITSTTGAIDKIRMDFPAGTGVGAAGIIERVGIGGGTLLKSGSSITYDLTTPVSIPAGTFIRLEIFGIKNPSTTSSTFTATITTRDSAGNLIDGPSQTNVYTIKKVGSSDLADGSVTSTKPAESFMKRVTVFDDPAGNAIGWDPNAMTTIFGITEPAVGPGFPPWVGVAVDTSVGGGFSICSLSGYFMEGFFISCDTPPIDGSPLHYVVITLPIHVVTP